MCYNDLEKTDRDGLVLAKIKETKKKDARKTPPKKTASLDIELEEQLRKVKSLVTLLAFSTVLLGCISLSCFSVGVGVSLAEKELTSFGFRMIGISIAVFFLFSYSSAKHQEKVIEKSKLERKYNRQYGKKIGKLEAKVRQKQKVVDANNKQKGKVYK